MDALGVAGDLGANDTGRVAMIGRAVHAANPAVAQQLDVKRTRRRTIVRTNRMANRNLGLGVHGRPSKAAIPAPTLNEFAAMAKKGPRRGNDRQIATALVAAASAQPARAPGRDGAFKA